MMHANPARAWKLTELAKAAGMSRTSFAQRFKAVTGVTPLGYLAEWRMRIAQRTLRQEDAPVSEIAARLGYASESAFSQAFKRVTGTRPRDYRSAQRQAAGVGETV
jgi:AraC-like DNA-binding protein